MAVWIVSHKPWGAGHLLMETNETKTRMRNELKRGKHRNENELQYGMQKQPEFKQAMRCSSWCLPNTYNLLQYQPGKETGLLGKCVTTNLSETGDFISINCVTHLNKYSVNSAHG